MTGVNDMTDHDDLRLAGTEAFEAVASALFAPLRVTHPCPQEFKAVVGHSAIRPVVVTRIKATTATVTRDHHSTASSDVEWMHFTLHHHGPLTAIQDDRTTTVKPGELFACDNTRPYRLIGTDPTDMTVLCVPGPASADTRTPSASAPHSPYALRAGSAHFTATHCPQSPKTSPAMV